MKKREDIKEDLRRVMDYMACLTRDELLEVLFILCYTDFMFPEILNEVKPDWWGTEARIGESFLKGMKRRMRLFTFLGLGYGFAYKLFHNPTETSIYIYTGIVIRFIREVAVVKERGIEDAIAKKEKYSWMTKKRYNDIKSKHLSLTKN